MVLCKICGTVYDEFYGLCPKCGTPCETEDDSQEALLPISKLTPPKASVPGALPSIEDALRSSGDADSNSAFSGGLPPIDPDATLPLKRPAADPDATLPLTRPAADPDATLPLTRPAADPDATLPLTRPAADPDATLPLTRPAIDPDATLPLTRPAFDPDATVPFRQQTTSFYKEPDATIPMRQPVSPVTNVGPKMQTQEVYVPDAAKQTQYGDNYDAPAAPSAGRQPQKKKSSTGKIAAIILIVIAVLAGCGVGSYFLFIKPNLESQVNIEELESQGDRYLSEGKTDDAISSYKKAIEAKPDSPQLYIKLADAYAAKNDTENAIKTLEEGYAKTSDSSIKTKLDDLKAASGTAVADDPDSLRSYARSMNMAIINVYAGINSGDLNSSVSSDKLNGLAPSKLPAPGAAAADRENAANALTISDVVTYSSLTDKITAATITTLVYDGAQVYYGADHTGKPLTFDTTIGEIRGFGPEESSEPEPSEESSEESSEPQASVITDPAVIGSELEDACRQLYEGVISGAINQDTPAESLNSLPASKLPKPTASAKSRKKYAETLTVADAIAYADLGASINGLNIIDYNYENAEINYRGSGTPLTLDTKLVDIMTETVEPSTVSKPEESSAVEAQQDARFVGQWKSVFDTKKYKPQEIEVFKSTLGWDEFDILLGFDGTASAYSITDNVTNIVGTGKWMSAGDDVSVTIDGDTIVFNYRNSVLTTSNLGDVVWFEKSDSPISDPQNSENSEPSEPSGNSEVSGSSQTSEPSDTPESSYDLPFVPSDAIGVICFKVPDDWDADSLLIRVYDYDGNKNESDAKMVPDENGIYTYTVNKYSATNYLFNNPRFVIISTVKGSGKVVQTEEIYVPRSSKLYTAEKQGRKYVLIEK